MGPDRNTTEHASGLRDLPPNVRRCMSGGVIGLFIDSFDVYLPALVLPAAMSYFIPKSLPPAMAVTVSTLLFTLSLLGRPLGGLVFGNLADRIGRKRVTIISAVGFTTCTLLIGVLPGYDQWGVAVIVIFAVLRLVDGMFLGGGYAAPIPLALEQSPPRVRGLVGGLIAAAAPASFVVISLIQELALARMPKQEFLSWGWRLPFFLAGVLGVFYIWHYSRVSEGNESYWRQRRSQRRQPLRDLFARGNARVLWQVLLLTTGYWFAAQVMVSLLPTLLTGVLHQSASDVTMLTLLNGLVTMVAMPVIAVLAQRYGRKRMLQWTSYSVVVGVSLSFLLMIRFAAGGAGFFAVAATAIIANVLTSGPLGVLITYLNERFPLSVRSTGYSVGYTFGLILPGLYSFWLLGLQTIMPYQYGPLVLIVLGGVLMFFGVRSLPETNADESLDVVPATTDVDAGVAG
jgi:MFS family permease